MSEDSKTWLDEDEEEMIKAIVHNELSGADFSDIGLFGMPKDLNEDEGLLSFLPEQLNGVRVASLESYRHRVQSDAKTAMALVQAFVNQLKQQQQQQQTDIKLEGKWQPFYITLSPRTITEESVREVFGVHEKGFVSVKPLSQSASSDPIDLLLLQAFAQVFPSSETSSSASSSSSSSSASDETSSSSDETSSSSSPSASSSSSSCLPTLVQIAWHPSLALSETDVIRVILSPTPGGDSSDDSDGGGDGGSDDNEEGGSWVGVAQFLRGGSDDEEEEEGEDDSASA